MAGLFHSVESIFLIVQHQINRVTWLDFEACAPLYCLLSAVCVILSANISQLQTSEKYMLPQKLFIFHEKLSSRSEVSTDVSPVIPSSGPSANLPVRLPGVKEISCGFIDFNHKVFFWKLSTSKQNLLPGPISHPVA